MGLNNLKVGDEVLVKGRNGQCMETIKTITPAGKFRLSNGNLYDSCGNRCNTGIWFYESMYVLTPEQRQQLKDQETIDSCVEYVRLCHKECNITAEQAMAIVAILNRQ